jgi:hypothetical protein
MYHDRDIARLLAEACHARWPGRHLAGLAEQLCCSKSAATHWVSGGRMPAKKMVEFAESLRWSAGALADLARGIDGAAEQVRLRGRQARGFQKVQDWDGTGVESDRRWRGGRGKRHPSE